MDSPCEAGTLGAAATSRDPGAWMLGWLVFDEVTAYSNKCQDPHLSRAYLSRLWPCDLELETSCHIWVLKAGGAYLWPRGPQCQPRCAVWYGWVLQMGFHLPPVCSSTPREL